MAYCWNFMKCRETSGRKVTLAVLGLDNAGKTATIRSIQGENPEDVTPTVGLSPVDLKIGQFDISVFDLGGTYRIRDIWKHYFSECHAIVYVVDSSDVERLQETKEALAKVLGHPRIAGKPVLLLANKQDKEGALNDSDVIDKLSLEELVKKHKCRCNVVPYSAVKAMGKKAIQDGLKWLLETVALDYDVIKERVEKDTAEQLEQEELERRERAERVRQLREEREKREREEALLWGMPTIQEEEDEVIMVNPFQPIRDVISQMEDKEEKEPQELKLEEEESNEQTEEKADPVTDLKPKRKRTFWVWKTNRVSPLLPDGPAKAPHRVRKWFGWIKRNLVAPL